MVNPARLPDWRTDRLIIFCCVFSGAGGGGGGGGGLWLTLWLGRVLVCRSHHVYILHIEHQLITHWEAPITNKILIHWSWTGRAAFGLEEIIMLSDISRLVSTSLVSVSQVAEQRYTANYSSLTITLLLQFSGWGSLVTPLTGWTCNYSEVKMAHCGCVCRHIVCLSERSSPSERLSSTDPTSPHQAGAQARLVSLVWTPPTCLHHCHHHHHQFPHSTLKTLGLVWTSYKLQVTSIGRCGLGTADSRPCLVMEIIFYAFLLNLRDAPWQDHTHSDNRLPGQFKQNHSHYSPLLYQF